VATFVLVPGGGHGGWCYANLMITEPAFVADALREIAAA